jgi:predicted SprT family Zn-dependent metalloprotease
MLALTAISMNAALTTDDVASAHRWLELWGTPELAAQATIEFSARMTRSLGRCYPDRRLIRIAAFVGEGDRGLLDEVLCHELAHLAARERHGERIRPHGPEWKALMRAAGFNPRARLPAPPNAPKRKPPRRRRRRRYWYLHRCPRCQLARAGKRVERRWRCAACFTAGLEGILDVFRRAL